MNKKPLLIAVILLLITASTNAQITGRIIDISDLNPVEGATVKVVGSNLSSKSDAQGQFTISTTQGKSLEFSSTGYISQTIKATNGIIVSLSKDVKSLDKVVVTAFNISRSEKSMGYAVSSVSGKELIKARETNLVSALAGKVSGVRVTNQSGALGGTSKIVIRGANSFSGSAQPLFIIDGMPVDNSSIGGSPFNANEPFLGTDFGNRVGDFGTDDIQDITVLKGAAATVLYGSRAKNGAIVITTKKGKKSSSPNVSFNSSTRFDDILKLPSLQNQYANGNYGDYDNKYINGWGPNISSMRNTPVKDFNGDWVILKAYPDNVSDYFQTGTTLMNNINVSGGEKNNDYRLSFTSTAIKGIVPNSKLNKYNLDINTGFDVNEKLSARALINFSSTDATGRPSQNLNDMNLLMANVYFPRTLDLEKLKTHYIDPNTGEQISISSDKNANNPYWISKFNKNNSNLNRLAANLIVSYKLCKSVTLENNIGTDFYNEDRISVIKKGTYGQLTGGFTSVGINNNNVNEDLHLTYDKKISSKWNAKVIVGANYFENVVKSTILNGQGLMADDNYTPANAQVLDTVPYYAQSRLIGGYFDATFDYKNLWFINVAGRNDWNSTLPKNNQSYFYPSVSSSLVFTDLLPKNKILSYGKLRAGWANVGGGTDPYMLDFAYTPAPTYNVQFDLDGTFPTAGNLLGYTGPSILPNANLKPQNQSSIEVGTDLAFFNNRISLSATYYNTQTKDQIFAVDVPLSTGYQKRMINAGNVANNGIELDLGLQILRNWHGLSWSANLNFNHNKQTVKEIDPESGLSSLVLTNGFNGFAIKAQKGESFGIYGTDWKRDPDGNIIIDQSTGLRATVSDVRLGNIAPDWIMGIGNTFTYRGVSLSALIDIRKGGVIYSGTISGLRTTGLAEETAVNRDATNYIDKGVYLNEDNKYVANTTPVASMQDYWKENYSLTNTVANLYDASYAKLREIRLSYILPVKQKCFFKTAEVGIEARNVLILKSNIPHIDPEVNAFAPGQAGEGVEFFNLPSTRSIGFNIRFTF